MGRILMMLLLLILLLTLFWTHQLPIPEALDTCPIDINQCGD